MGPFPRAMRAPASCRAPVPQSKMSRSPALVVSSTHEVLPPKWIVPGPGVAIDPRVPQKRTFMSLPPGARERRDRLQALPDAGATVRAWPAVPGALDVKQLAY